MRLLMVVDGLWNGGSERQLALLASSLPASWSVGVFSLQDGPYRPILERHGIDVCVFERRTRRDVTPGWRLNRAAADFDPDLVHAWGWMSAASTLPHCRAGRVPLLNGTIRQGMVTPRRRIARRMMLQLADHVVANNLAGLRAWNVPEARSTVIHNGFDTGRLRALDGLEPPVHDGRTHVVMAARMYPAKDWDTLLAAAALLSAEEPDGWSFVAVGDGPERARLIEGSASLIETGSLTFLREGEDVLPAIASADVGVLLTDVRVAAEGQSNTIMEYMACGLPVVATDSGGTPELIEQDVTGILVPPLDASALAAALRGIRRDPTQALTMGDCGRRRLDETFSVQAMSRAYVALYERLIGEHGRRRR